MIPPPGGDDPDDPWPDDPGDDPAWDDDADGPAGGAVAAGAFAELDEARAALLHRFIGIAAATPWFAHLGQPLTPVLRHEAEAYLAALGFPGAAVALVRNWREAAVAAETRDFDSPAFEVEEQLRAALTGDAVALWGEEIVETVLTHVAAELAGPIGVSARNAGAVWAIRDREITTAAAGAALQAAHAAALLLLAGDADEGHPAALKFRLFERGRWPVGVTGATFNLF